MAPFRAALAALAFFVAVLGAERTARAAPPPPAPAPAPSSVAPLTPGDRAIRAGEEQGQGSTIPDLSERAALPLAGKPILRTEVVVSGSRWSARPEIKSVRPGEPLSLEAGRRAMREVLATGRFAGATVETFAEGDGAVLRLYVLPRRLIASVQLRGGALDTADTLEAAEIGTGAELTGPLLEEVSSRIRRYYAHHGFPAAEVDLDTTDTDKPNEVVLAIEIKPGAPRTIAQRIFVIGPRADKEVGDLKATYRLAAGDRVDEGLINEADHELTEALRQHGFPRAEVRHALRNVGPWGYLYIYLEPGPRLVPDFDGNRAFDADQLTEALNLAKAPDGRVAELVERLRVFYVRRGFLDVEVSVTEQGAPEDPVHPLLFTIREHPQVSVVRRVFPCLSGEISPDDLGGEIDAVLREELPGSELFFTGDPRTISKILGEIAGRRAAPADINPLVTYSLESYERALKHLRDLVHSKGYLNAVIGPVSVMRATCSKRSPAGQCIPEPFTVSQKAACLKDSLGLPLPEPPTPDALTCRPNPAHNIECSPELSLRIPVNLGPQTTLYDLAFEGNRALTEAELAKLAELPLGSPLSNVELDAAQSRLLDEYRRRGYAYVEIRSVIEPSPDRSRARVRFSVTERDQVTVAGFVLKGATRTDKDLILRRVALILGRPFQQNQVRLTEERIAALGTFSSVSVGLEDPDVPQRRKRVVITVVEQTSQYLEPRLGFSSGEGVRFAVEYGHRNIGGLAIAFALRIQLSYLFDFLIVDQGVRQNYGLAPLELPLPFPAGTCPNLQNDGCHRSNLQVLDRLERRNSISFTFPEIGLGPLVSLSLEGIDVRHNQRDFGLTKDAFLPTLTYRPRRQITVQLSASGESNDVTIFNERSPNATDQPLLVPEGATIALSQRASFIWDFRDNPFNAQRGGLISTSVEHVDAYPTATPGNKATKFSHFLRLTGKASAYIKLPLRLVLALSLGAGYNFQLIPRCTEDSPTLTSCSTTYPDRLFFLGGVDSVRSYLADALVPEDVADRILHPDRYPGKPLTINDVPIRGGDLSVNPRVELRIPITDVFQTGIFVDAGNVWVDPSKANPFQLHYGIGAGVRIITPVGPVALDLGINPAPRPWEKSQALPFTSAFHFSIGLF